MKKKRRKDKEIGNFVCEIEECGLITPTLYAHDDRWICEECFIKELSKETRVTAKQLLKDGEKKKKRFKKDKKDSSKT